MDILGNGIWQQTILISRQKVSALKSKGTAFFQNVNVLWKEL